MHDFSEVARSLRVMCVDRSVDAVDVFDAVIEYAQDDGGHPYLPRLQDEIVPLVVASLHQENVYLLLSRVENERF